MSRRNPASINSGSMADIAFLLLIFFLLSSTISAEKGIKRVLHMPCPSPNECLQTVEEQNLLQIIVNANSELMVNDELITIDDLQSQLISFIDNNGKNTCVYCHGAGNSMASDHPKNAFISLQVHDKTKYDLYVLVQDEISKAYYKLRSDYAKHVFNKDPQQLNNSEINATREAYPFQLVEVKDQN